MAVAPHRAFHVTHMIKQSRVPLLPHNDRRAVGLQHRVVGEFGRIGHVGRHGREHGVAGRFDRQPPGAAGNPVGVLDTAKDFVMRLLDAREKAVAVGPGQRADRVDAEQVGEARSGAATPGLVEQAGFKGSKQRAARRHVVPQLLALPVAQPGDVGQQERGILAEGLGPEIILMDEVEEKTPLQQRIIESVHELLQGTFARRFVEDRGALTHDDADIGEAAPPHEVPLMARVPLQVTPAGFEPAAVLAQAGLAAHPVVPDRHAAGRRLVHPDFRLRGGFGDIAPAYTAAARRVGAGDVGDRTPLHDRRRHAPLLRSTPDRGGVAPAPLVVAVEPLADPREAEQVRRGPQSVAQVGEKQVVRFLFLGDPVPQFPELDDPVVVPLPRGHRARLRKLAALVARADRDAAERRPGVGEESVDLVVRVDFAHDRRHMLREIGAEDAGAVEARVLVMGKEATGRVAHEPFGMRPGRFLPLQVRAQARDHPDAALPGRGGGRPEKVALAEELAAAVEGTLRGVKRQDARHADEHGVDLQAGPVVSPGLHIEFEGIALVEIKLPDAVNALVPGRRPDRWLRAGQFAQEPPRRTGGQHAGDDRTRPHEELPAIDIHGAESSVPSPDPKTSGHTSGRRAG